MVRDPYPVPQLGFLIKFIEPDLTVDQLAEETHYLQADLQDLGGLGQTRFRLLQSPRGEALVSDGVQFEASADRLRPILKRLCDRLQHKPLETLVLIQQGSMRLQVQTHTAEVLASMLGAAEAMLPPQSIYLGKAAVYSQSQGELSPAELANLDLLQQYLGLSQEEADHLKATALGPYQTLAEKRQRFAQVLMLELSSHNRRPLPEESWQVMVELADNLALPQAEAHQIYQDQLHQIQVEAEAIRQQDMAVAVAQAEAQAAAEATRQQQQQEREHQIEQYRAMVRQALATSLYPPTFDQGRLEQARQLWHISPERALGIEEVIRGELYGAITSELGVDYSRLRQLLWAQDWRAADEETENAILKALSPNRQPLDREAIAHLSCGDLLTIDQLWSRYSEGRFGFRVQQQIYHRVEQQTADFLRTLDWRGPTISLSLGRKPYKRLQFNDQAPDGHLPTWRWCCSSLEAGYDLSEGVIQAMMDRLNRCFALDTPQGSE